MAYDNFVNNSTNVQFFSGTQTDLTPYIKGTTEAVEGAFYLTTDTQKLYVGRKNSTDNKVYAVQVSRGVTFVATSGDLPSATANDIEEGELYYITTTNVLAALKEKLPSTTPKTYEWVQINPPTGINSVNTSANTVSNTATVTTELATGAGIKSGDFKIAGGSNVTVTSSNDAVNGIGTVTIAAQDTTYSIGTAATTAGDTDGAKIGLKKDGASALDSQVNITGSGTVAVTSDANGNIDIHGPSFTGITVEGKAGTANGMSISVAGTDGDGAALNISGDVDPIVEYGDGTKSQAHFKKVTRNSTDYIIADLDVYTKAQADSAIDDAIDAKLATANAMTYKGVITSAEDLKAAIGANGAHNGDVYKVGALTTPFEVNGVQVDTGDLIILTGQENSSGQLLTNAATPAVVTATTTDAYLLGDPNNSIVGVCDLVPSGDEPELTASIVTAASGATTEAAAPNIALFDGKGGGTDSSTNILTTRFISGNKITVIGEATSNANKKSTGQDLKLTFNHQVTSRTNSTNETLTSASANATDDIGQNSYQLFVFSDPSALTADAYGHITGFKGKTITFRHNKINNPVISYGNHATDSNHAIVGISISDSIGNTASANLDVKSSTLAVSGDSTNNRLTVDLKWQTF